MEGVPQNVINNLSAKTNTKGSELIRVGTWGKSPHLGSPQNRWSYQLERNHRLKSITIDHGDLIYSLIFTSQLGESTYTSDKIGGWGRGPMEEGDKVSEITFDGDEEINGISGTVALSRGNNPGFIIISSLSFVTNKKTHGPFGTVRGDPFTVSWEDATCAGFYGLCGGYLDSIGVYLKAHSEILRIGTWGRRFPYNIRTTWNYMQWEHQRLNRITILRGMVPILRRTSILHLIFNAPEVDDQNGLPMMDHVILDEDEEIIAISGTVETPNDKHIVISSISFKTNKKDHGPFGDVQGTPFSASWDVGSFVGFYGYAGDYLDSIGVYLKSTDGIKV